MDSRCSSHMSGKASLFSKIKEKYSGTITLRNKGKCRNQAFGKINKHPTISIDNIYLVDGLKFNLLSIAQLCDKGNQVVFIIKNML